MEPILFVYDGDCPICTLGAGAYRVDPSHGIIETINARLQADHPIMAEIARRNLDLDQGMVVKYRGALYHGARAMQLLSKLAKTGHLHNRLGYGVLQSTIGSALLYPIFKFVRRVALLLTGKQLINSRRAS